MRASRLTLVALTALLACGAYQTYAYHQGGVAECVGCHSMHESKGGALLLGTDPSSTCLNCHNSTSPGGYRVSTDESLLTPGVPPGNRSPGGDFAWLKKDYSWSPRPGTTENEEGDHHGHNIVAIDYNYAQDGHHATSPGGSFPADKLACTSCHDQHSKLRRLSDGTIATSGAPIIASGSYNNSPTPAAGQAVGVYRLLRGAGSDPGTGGANFVNPVPAAVAPSNYNRSEQTTDTRVAYGAGMAKFCASCHANMHTDSGKLVHTVDANMGSDIADNYNEYVGSGDLTGNSATSYDSLIPFQFDNSTDYAALAAMANNDGSVTTGPASTDRLNCLTCHRAHASGWAYATRWDNEIELIIVDGEWPGTDAVSAEAKLAKWAKGRTVAERARAYNDTPATDYATFQRVLCNKCHAKD